MNQKIASPTPIKPILKPILKKCDEVAAILKSLSNPVRLKILCQVMDGEQTVNALTEFCEISQSSMSQMLGRMKNEGILKSRRDGTFVYYSLQDQKMIHLLKAIKEIYCS